MAFNWILIFFRTIKPIEASEELLVWYGDEYAEALGIPLEARKPSDFAPSRNQEQLEQKKSVALSPRMDKSLEGPIQGVWLIFFFFFFF